VARPLRALAEAPAGGLVEALEEAEFNLWLRLREDAHESAGKTP
jgi:hypothetical protein